MVRFSMAVAVMVCATWAAAADPPPARDGLRVWLDASADETLETDETGRLVRWRPYPDLTDEFTGDKLDEAKWWPTNPKWLGRQPALFHPSNVQVADGELQLTMRRWFPDDGPMERGYLSGSTITPRRSGPGSTCSRSAAVRPATSAATT